MAIQEDEDVHKIPRTYKHRADRGRLLETFEYSDLRVIENWSLMESYYICINVMYKWDRKTIKHHPIQKFLPEEEWGLILERLKFECEWRGKKIDLNECSYYHFHSKTKQRQYIY